MANEEHLAILKQGVDAWNKWRKWLRDIRPDLSEADLRGANLIGADLIQADLSQADLSRADLSRADLIEADLSGTNLNGALLGEAHLNGAHLNGAHLNGALLFRADLGMADLSGADLFKADLIQADLGMADLSEANLREANLNGAHLIGAHLREANLVSADLSEAHLGWADLSEANLFGASLNGANLSGAILSKAHLGEANLSEADLSEANVEGATVEGTVFGDVDLSKVKGLDTVEHRGPSYIDIHTLYRSKGIIPEVFLRGCGVPDEFIAQIAPLFIKPIQFYSCFISYSSQNQGFAEQLHNDLQAKGVRCWFAPEDLKIGDKFRTRIDEAIRLHDKLLLILSEHSINSDWVEKEVETAFEKERQQKRIVLFPVRLDDVIWGTGQSWAADIRRTRQIGDFANWKDHDAYQKAFERLLRDLKAESAAASE